MSYMWIFVVNTHGLTVTYTLSLHDALPISRAGEHFVHHFGDRHDLEQIIEIGAARRYRAGRLRLNPYMPGCNAGAHQDRKSTRLNSSHGYISYAVFCLKKKRTTATSVRARC